MCACSVMVSLNLFPSVRFPFGEHQERGLWPDPNWKSATHGLRSLQFNADWLTILNDFSARAEKLGLARSWAEEKWSQGTGHYLCVSIVMREGERKVSRLNMEKLPTPPHPFVLVQSCATYRVVFNFLTLLTVYRKKIKVVRTEYDTLNKGNDSVSSLDLRSRS